MSERAIDETGEDTKRFHRVSTKIVKQGNSQLEMTGITITERHHRFIGISANIREDLEGRVTTTRLYCVTLCSTITTMFFYITHFLIHANRFTVIEPFNEHITVYR